MNKYVFKGVLIMIIITFSITIAGCSLIGGKEESAVEDEPVVEEEQELNIEVVEEDEDKNVIDIKAETDADNIRGEEDAPVTIIIYCNFESSFCAKHQENIDSIKEEFPDKIREVYRHYYLPSHTLALKAAEAAECAGEQGSFWEMAEMLYTDAAEDELNLEKYKENAQELELDIEEFDECLESGGHAEKIANSIFEAKRAGIASVPTSYINDRIVIGAVSVEDYEDEVGEQKGLRTIIEEELEVNSE